jgi:hypothetical protein
MEPAPTTPIADDTYAMPVGVDGRSAVKLVECQSDEGVAKLLEPKTPGIVMMREAELASKVGLPRIKLAELRRKSLKEGQHWMYTPVPRTVVYLQAGIDRVVELIGAPALPAPQPPPASDGWLSYEAIPKLAANGLILTKGRPGWWTTEEAVVRSTAFANRKAILVHWRGRDVICRVKSASAFVVGQVIPVRPYQNIVLAARQPRWPGKW